MQHVSPQTTEFCGVFHAEYYHLIYSRGSFSWHPDMDRAKHATEPNSGLNRSCAWYSSVLSIYLLCSWRFPMSPESTDHIAIDGGFGMTSFLGGRQGSFSPVATVELKKGGFPGWPWQLKREDSRRSHAVLYLVLCMVCIPLMHNINTCTYQERMGWRGRSLGLVSQWFFRV
jgi:hypothetical protein